MKIKSKLFKLFPTFGGNLFVHLPRWAFRKGTEHKRRLSILWSNFPNADWPYFALTAYAGSQPIFTVGMNEEGL